MPHTSERTYLETLRFVYIYIYVLICFKLFTYSRILYYFTICKRYCLRCILVYFLLSSSLS